MIVGVDIGGHHVAAATVDPAVPGALVAGSYRHRAVAADAARDDLLGTWAATIAEVADAAGRAGVRGVGIAMPGPFDYRAGIAWFETNAKFRSLYGVDVGTVLAARLGLPVGFVNDAAAFALGCVAMGDATGRRVLALTLGTGLGSAFLEDGLPVIAGDAVPPGGALWDRPFGAGIADDHVSARWLLGEGAARLGRRFDGVAALADAARAGDRDAAALFDDYGANLAAVVAPWIDRFRPDAIVLGGRVCGAFDLFGAALRRAAAAAAGTPPVAIHPNTEDAAIVGAARAVDPAFRDRLRDRLPDR